MEFGKLIICEFSHIYIVSLMVRFLFADPYIELFHFEDKEEMKNIALMISSDLCQLFSFCCFLSSYRAIGIIMTARLPKYFLRLMQDMN